MFKPNNLLVVRQQLIMKTDHYCLSLLAGVADGKLQQMSIQA
jgi:hypothetical protein